MNPPPLPAGKKKSRVWIIFLLVGVVLVGTIGYGAFQAFRTFTRGGFAANLDSQFGDQYLKTAVALIELHKVRTGRYPQDLSQLKYVGQWDLIALQSVRYVVASDGLSYYVEVQRGWMGKPALNLPPDFWRGTGYNPKLANQK